jgi:hypothetical protein
MCKDKPVIAPENQYYLSFPCRVLVLPQRRYSLYTDWHLSDNYLQNLKLINWTVTAATLSQET